MQWFPKKHYSFGLFFKNEILDWVLLAVMRQGQIIKCPVLNWAGFQFLSMHYSLCLCSSPRLLWHKVPPWATLTTGDLYPNTAHQVSYWKVPSSTCRFQKECVWFGKNVHFAFSRTLRTGRIFSASIVLWTIVAKILIKILLWRKNTVYNKNTSFTIHYSIKRLNLLALKN